MTDDIEDIRQRKLEKLKEQAQSNSTQENNAAQTDESSDIESILRDGLTDDARQRLNAVEMAKPERAKGVKKKLAVLISRGKVETPVTEKQVKKVLQKVADEESTDFDIRRR